MALRADTVKRREEIYRDALSVILSDYPRDLTVESVAHSIGTSRRQLQRVLDEVGGVAFRDLLTRVRMQAAGRMLVETPTPVNVVARHVGYSQPAQFAKTFRRHFGAPPSVYRTSPQSSAATPAANGVAARLSARPAVAV